MKFLILFALVVCVTTAPLHSGYVNTGHSAQQYESDGHGNYEFGYNEDHATGGTFRKEKGGPGYQVGSYGLRDADGRIRIVHYIADAHGFRATISTNEPGVDVKQDPAATSFTSAGASHAALAPVAHVPQAYSEPAHHTAAPLHDDLLYGHASQAVISKVPTPYEADLGHYSPALAAPLMANAYEASLLKSAYLPDYAPAEYGQYDPAVPAAHGYGDRLYSPSYNNYY